MLDDNLLVQIRKSRNLTQKQVADCVCVTDQTVSNWETGRSEPKLTPKQTLALCKILQCSLEELVAAVEYTFKYSK
ncbi:helix-turn-helix transcriptional regulator [Leptolyngbya ohadii]|uniref:helix-turn-helix transcriptional regulator n=1 Tax=Leptolyngbya ohadii TaxID=1962290 RepID=UPI000B5A165B|nr:helix-turn-helix transcriptional regulator [Leptolyngbya ohadii]